MQKLKRVVIKEELVALTGDFIKAVILNQFIYWSERVGDFDKFIQEEKVRAEQHGEELGISPTNGWIYKKAEELAEETMLGVSPATMGRHIKVLVEKGWLEQRQNPKYKWDQTKQYRVNLFKIQLDLLEIGYFLEGYKVDTKTLFEHANFKMKNADFKMKIGDSKLKNHAFNLKNQTIENEKAIPEITTKKKDDDDYIKEQATFFQQEFITEAQDRHVPQEEIQDTLKELEDTPFHLEALDSTFEKVMPKYAIGEVSKFSSYFVSVLKREQRRLKYTQSLPKPMSGSKQDFPFYNWLEPSDDH